MTDMEILQIADQCGVVAVTQHQWDGKRFNHTDDYLDGDGAALVIFAKAIAQHERERCAKLRDELHFYHFDKTASVSKAELVASVEQALDDYAKLIRTGDV